MAKMIFKEKTQRLLAMVLLCVMVCVAVAGTAFGASEAVRFTDVPSTHWAFREVNEVAEAGVVNGVGNGLFAPDWTLTHSQYLTMIVRLRWEGQVKALDQQVLIQEYKRNYSVKDNITNVPWWYPYTYVAKQYDLCNGAAEVTSRPDANISRYEMAVVMHNFLRSIGATLPTDAELEEAKARVGDVSVIPAKYLTSVLVCFRSGLIAGVDTKGTFAGDLTVTRAQAAMIVSRCLGLYIEDADTEPQEDANYRWGKDPVHYPTTGSAESANKNGFYTVADVNLDPKASLSYQVLTLVNEERAKEGLAPFQWVPTDECEEYTLLRATELVSLFSHERPCGESNTSISMENAAKGYMTPEGVVKGWMSSTGHRRLIMSPDDVGEFTYLYLCAAQCQNRWVMTVWADGHLSNYNRGTRISDGYHVQCELATNPYGK